MCQCWCPFLGFPLLVIFLLLSDIDRNRISTVCLHSPLTIYETLQGWSREITSHAFECSTSILEYMECRSSADGYCGACTIPQLLIYSEHVRGLVRLLCLVYWSTGHLFLNVTGIFWGLSALHSSWMSDEWILLNVQDHLTNCAVGIFEWKHLTDQINITFITEHFDSHI